MKTLCKGLMVFVGLMLLGGVASAESTDWCWEGSGYNCDLCDGNNAGFALECQGDYCAALRLDCDTNGFGKTGNRYWHDSFSDEDGLEGTNNYCAPGYIVDGVDCDGYDNRCDDVSLHCAEIDAVEGTCYWMTTQWISEEPEREHGGDYIGRYVRCGDGEYIHGIECRGPWCDEMAINCCPYAP